MIFHQFCHILLIRSKLLGPAPCKGRWYEGRNARRQESLRAISEAACYTTWLALANERIAKMVKICKEHSHWNLPFPSVLEPWDHHVYKSEQACWRIKMLCEREWGAPVGRQPIPANGLSTTRTMNGAMADHVDLPAGHRSLRVQQRSAEPVQTRTTTMITHTIASSIKWPLF